MAGTPTQLPAFVKLKFEGDEAFTAMLGGVDNVARMTRHKLDSAFADSAQSAKGEFDRAFGAMEASLSKAVARPRNAGGSLDLGVDEMKRAALAHDARATAAQEAAAAVRAAAAAEGDYSAKARTAIAAADALAVQERNAAQAARDQAEALEQVQRQLDRHASATDVVVGSSRRLAGANDNVINSQGALRTATLQSGQQMQDLAISLYSGQKASIVFAQQLPQLAFALSGLEGSANKTLDRLGKFGTFMSGPWGLAIGLGVGVLGTLVAELWATEEAAKAAEIGADGLSQAQSVLGGMFDMTSGKIQNQNELLKMNARLTALNLRAEAMAQRDKAKDAFGNFGKGNLGLSFGNKVVAALGVPVYASTSREMQVRGLLSDMQEGKITREQALQQSEKLDFTGLAVTKTEFQQALIDQVSAEFKDRTAALIDKSLNDGNLASGLRKPGTQKKTGKADTDKGSKDAEQLANFGKQAAEAIARLNEKFDESPRLIDQAAQATRELDGIIAELEKREPIGFEKLMADAETAKTAIEDALFRPVQMARQESERRLQVQDLLAAGRDDEVAALQAIWALEEKLGGEEVLRAKVQALITAGKTEEAAVFERLLSLYPGMKREAADLARIEAERTREAQRRQALLEAELNVVTTAQRSLTDLLSGRGGNFFGDMKQALKDLQGQRLFESLFGDAFRDVEDQLRQRSPLGRAESRLAAGVDTATGTVGRLATATDTAATQILAAADRLAAESMGGDGLGNPDIVVTGVRPKAKPDDEVSIARKSAFELANAISGAMLAPLKETLGRTFGTSFALMLGGVVQGAMAGNMVGGTPGGILGALRGGVFEYGPDMFGKGMTEKLLGGFDKALGGAQTGTMAAGLMKSLGIKTSTTGAQIGGAIGSFVPIPGGEIIGSVIGGLLGGMFKKTKWGRVNLTSGGFTTEGNSGKSEEAATGAGDSFMESLQNIADELGGSVGDFGAITLGVRHGDWRVNTGGTSLKKKNGAKDFNDDQEAAIKYAIMEAIERGAIEGIRESTNRLLKAGDDLDKALQDALDWENAFRELRRYKDPLGAALDDLDKEFEKLIDLAEKAGASSEEWAQLEELYGIKQAEVFERIKDEMLGSLQGLLDDLTIGDNGLSLRDRRAAAMTDYNDLAARVSAGDSTAYDEYAQAARELLDIEREMYGSQQSYFDRLNEVTDLTRTRIEAEGNVFSIAENRDSPFDSTGAVRDAVTSQTGELATRLDAVNQNLGATNARLDAIATALARTGFAGRVNFASNY